MATVTALDTTEIGMAPGCYLTLRREAAGLTIEQLARRSALPLRVAELLSDAEADRVFLPRGVLSWLAGLINVDADVYGCLVALIPAGRICVGCGCTWNDACWTVHGPCGWSAITNDFDVCTVCTGEHGQ